LDPVTDADGDAFGDAVVAEPFGTRPQATTAMQIVAIVAALSGRLPTF
jgi:hypothetical protein